MKGLIIKDLINLRSQMKLYGLIFIMWFFLGYVNHSASFFSGLMIMFVVLIPMTAVSFDAKYKWDRYALTMPVSRRDLVHSKYLLMLLTLAATAAVTFAGSFVLSGDLRYSAESTWVLMCTGVLMNAILMPLIFKFGVEKGRFVVIFAAILVALSITGVGKLAGRAQWLVLPNFTPTVWGLILAAAAVLATLASMAVSDGVYRRKEF